MTRDVAIATLQSMIPTPCRADGKSTTHILQTMALEMAIRELKQEPYEDCISREAAIDAIKHVVIKFPRLITDKQQKTVIETIDLTKDAFKNALIKLPSVEPERKTGKWIVYEDCEGKTRTCTCNLCGYETGEYTWENPNYCENCGAKMEVEDDT